MTPLSSIADIWQMSVTDEAMSSSPSCAFTCPVSETSNQVRSMLQKSVKSNKTIVCK